MSDKPKRDWGKTRVHFVCGFVIGGLGSFSTGGGWAANLAVAFLFGLLAGVFLDKFWERFLSWW